MGETTDQLRQEVDRKREDAAQKIDAIEQRVADTANRVQEGVTQTTEQVKATVQDSVEGAIGAVTDTTQQVADQVKQTTQQVTEQVKANFDWQKQIEERPLVMLGAAMLGGFVLGSLTGGDDRERHLREPSYRYGGTGQGYQGAVYGYAQSREGMQSHQAAGGYRAAASGYASSSGGVMSGIRGVLEDSGLHQTLTGAAAALLGSAGERLRTTLEQQVPGFSEQMRQQTGQRTANTDRSPAQANAGDRGDARQQPATADAAGHTAPYFGEQQNRQSGSDASAVSG